MSTIRHFLIEHNPGNQELEVIGMGDIILCGYAVPVDTDVTLDPPAFLKVKKIASNKVRLSTWIDGATPDTSTYSSTAMSGLSSVVDFVITSALHLTFTANGQGRDYDLNSVEVILDFANNRVYTK